MREACRLAEGNPGLELGLALGEGWREGRDKVLVSAEHRRLRALGRAADRRVDRQAGQGARPGPARRRRPRRPAAGGAPARPLRARRRSSSAGSSRPPSRARSSASTRSTSRTSRPRRTRRTRCCARGEAALEPEGSLDEALAGAKPGEDYVAILAFVDPAREAELEPLVARARETGCAVTDGPRPALPALDRPAAQGRPEPRRLRPGGRRPRRGAADSRAATSASGG